MQINPHPVQLSQLWIPSMVCKKKNKNLLCDRTTPNMTEQPITLQVKQETTDFKRNYFLSSFECLVWARRKVFLAAYWRNLSHTAVNTELERFALYKQAWRPKTWSWTCADRSHWECWLLICWCRKPDSHPAPYHLQHQLRNNLWILWSQPCTRSSCLSYKIFCLS